MWGVPRTNSRKHNYKLGLGQKLWERKLLCQISRKKKRKSDKNGHPFLLSNAMVGNNMASSANLPCRMCQHIQKMASHCMNTKEQEMPYLYAVDNIVLLLYLKKRLLYAEVKQQYVVEILHNLKPQRYEWKFGLAISYLSNLRHSIYIFSIPSFHIIWTLCL